MASIIKASINLSEIPKDKIYVGKKGKYLLLTFFFQWLNSVIFKGSLIKNRYIFV